MQHRKRLRYVMLERYLEIIISINSVFGNKRKDRDGDIEQDGDMEQDGGETIREAFFLMFMKRLIVYSFSTVYA